MDNHHENREERLANKSMSAAQKSFRANLARESNNYSSSYSPDSNYYDTNQQQSYQQYQQPPYQQQPVMPKKRHHWKWLLWVIAAIIVFFGGVSFINNRGTSEQSSQPQKTKVIREVPKEQNQNNNNSNNEDSKLQAMSKKLDDQMSQMKLDQNEQRALLQKFQQQSANTQKHIYDMVQQYQHWIPTNGMKRTILQHYLNRYNK